MANFHTFESYLKLQRLGENGIKSRVSRARKAEEILGRDLDDIVRSDSKMGLALATLKESGDHQGNWQNALRWYYRMVNRKEFPQMKDID